MNRIDHLFKNKPHRVLSVYFTAGYPHLTDTVPVIKTLSDQGADMIEIGVPFSDPVADGPVIQHSDTVALKNGMTLKKLIGQLKGIRQTTGVPLLLMSYLNPVLRYGMEAFCRDIATQGIDGVIIPDLPPEEYIKEYKMLFTTHNLKNIFLVTPQTPGERIHFLDREGEGFLYVVSSRSTTGMKNAFSKEQTSYFRHLREMNLTNKLLAGFGISNRKTFDQACRYLNGAIVGSAYIKALEQEDDPVRGTRKFIHSIEGKNISG